MAAPSSAIQSHLRALSRCTRCPAMHKPVVVGRPVASKVLLVGQAPGVKEPLLGRPFAWTAGKTLFRWLDRALGWDEDTVRDRIYFAAVCRCFPGKNPKGGDRVPDETEIGACADWLDREFALLQPRLVLPVGKLAITQFLKFDSLASVVGRTWSITRPHGPVDVIPLPHPSGASTWHRMEPGKSLLEKSLALVARHPALTDPPHTGASPRNAILS
jgi:uracil-DNA glycosylase